MAFKINLIYFSIFNCFLFLQIEGQNLNPNGIGVCSLFNETTGNYQFHCCNGYRISFFAEFNHESFTGDCEPVCADGCNQNGNCIAANTCSCFPGFGGKFCDKSCSASTFGEKCEFNCKEILYSKYNNRSCDCEKTQINDEQCRNKCKCILYKCDAGLIGLKCDEKCTEGKFGEFCSEDCACIEENTIECNNVNGQCKCKENYYGSKCELHCDGILKCIEINNCICELISNQKINELIDNKNLTENKLIEIKNNEKKDNENHQINELSNSSLIENRLLIKSELDNKMKKNSSTIKDDLDLVKKILVITIISVLIIIILLISLILNQTFKIKNLEKRIKLIDIKYSNENDYSNQEYSSNQLYELSNSFYKKPINCNYKNKDSFSKSRQFDDNYPSLINRESTTSDMYETIDEMKNKFNKFNQNEW